MKGMQGRRSTVVGALMDLARQGDIRVVVTAAVANGMATCTPAPTLPLAGDKNAYLEHCFLYGLGTQEEQDKGKLINKGKQKGGEQAWTPGCGARVGCGTEGGRGQ